MARMVDHALAYAKLGWKIFPIKAGTKDTPLCKWGTEATTDSAQILKWWGKHPTANIGLACGQSGLFVIDIDTKDGRRGKQTIDQLDIEGDALTATLTQRTPSGGLQMVYKGEGPTTQNIIGGHLWPDGVSHVDTRGVGARAGGYVVLPPSQTARNDESGTHTGMYQWTHKATIAPIDQWVLDMCAPDPLAGIGDNSQAPAVELDSKANLAWGEHFLTHDAKNSIQGKGGEKALFDNVAVLKDHGISEVEALLLISTFFNRPRNIDAQLGIVDAYDWPYCEPVWDEGEEDDPTTLNGKIHNVYTYAVENAPGSKTAEADFADVPEPDPLTPEETAATKKAEAKKKERAEEREQLKKAARVIQEKLADWAYVVQMDRFVQMSDTEFVLKTPVFDNKFAHLKPKKVARLSKLLFEHRLVQMFDKSVFRPGEPQVTEDGHFNFYKTPDIVAAQGDFASWTEHMEYLFPNEISRNNVLNWIAWLLQNLTLKPKHALLIAGHVQGTGKSYIAEVLTRILDKANVSVIGSAELSSTFNRWALGAKLLLIEELRALERREIANKLHPIITQEIIPINDKGIATFKVDNCFGILAMTNDDAAVQLDNTDRRYLVERTDAVPRSAAYYDELYKVKLLDDSFIAAVAYDLLQRPLGSYSAAGRAPETAAKTEMIESSRSELETWLHENQDSPQCPLSNDLVNIEDVIENLPPRLMRNGSAMSRVIASFIKYTLRGVRINQTRLPDGGKVVRLWALRGKIGIIERLEPAERAALYVRQRSGAQKAIETDAAEHAAEDFEE